MKKVFFIAAACMVVSAHSMAAGGPGKSGPRPRGVVESKAKDTAKKAGQKGNAASVSKRSATDITQEINTAKLYSDRMTMDDVQGHRSLLMKDTPDARTARAWAEESVAAAKQKPDLSELVKADLRVQEAYFNRGKKSGVESDLNGEKEAVEMFIRGVLVDARTYDQAARAKVIELAHEFSSNLKNQQSEGQALANAAKKVDIKMEKLKELCKKLFR